MNGKPSIRFPLALTLSLGLGVATTLGVLSSVAQAQGLTVKMDEVKIDGGTADFGSGAHALGSPTGSGTVKWEFSTVNGSLTARATVSGTVYWDSLDSQGC